MAILAERVDGVTGVDTRGDALAAAAVSPIGAVLASTDPPANACGYRRPLDFGRERVPGRRCWALEGIGSYGAGLESFLSQAGGHVVEVCRPKRAADRGGRKTDMPGDPPALAVGELLTVVQLGAGALRADRSREPLGLQGLRRVYWSMPTACCAARSARVRTRCRRPALITRVAPAGLAVPRKPYFS